MKKLATVPCFAALCLVGSASAINLVGNGSFDVNTFNPPGAPVAGEWTSTKFFGGAISQDVGVGNPAPSAFLSVSYPGSPAGGPSAAMTQETLPGSITPGQAYDFSFEILNANYGPGTVMSYLVDWVDGSGANAGQALFMNNALYFGTQGGMGLVAPPNADRAFINITLATGAFDGASGNVNVDNVNFSPVPEPSTYAAIAGILAIGLAVLRRRRA